MCKSKIYEVSIINKYIKMIIILFLCIVAIILIGFSILMLTEYKPKDIESLVVEGEATKVLHVGDDIKFLTYNVGYLSLDKTQDFFLDGGKGVMPETDENVKRNLNGVIDIILKEDPDICLLQEIDLKAKRSYYMNQYKELGKVFNGTSTFSMYHKCLCIPYPIFNMVGYVEAGMSILNKYNGVATRISLPSAYSFPMKQVMFKRNLLKQVIDIANTDKKLIIFNLHLEAYDNNGTRLKQLEILKSEMQKEYNNGNYVIAGGDFNQTFPVVDKENYPILDNEYFVASTIPEDFLPNEWKYAVDDTVPTCRLLNSPYSGNFEDTQLYVLDGYIVTPNIEIKEVKTINTNFEYSDHQPVLLIIKLN